MFIILILIIFLLIIIIISGRFYKYAMQDVLAYQLSTHNTLYQEVQQVEAVVLEMLRTNPFPVPNSNPDVIRILTEFTNNQVDL
jgi:ABC-type phosphate transport system auxiliary subunit